MPRFLYEVEQMEFDTPHLSDVVPFLNKLRGPQGSDDYEFMEGFAKKMQRRNGKTYNCNRREAFAKDMMDHGDLICLSDQTRKFERDLMVKWSADGFTKIFLSKPTNREVKAWQELAKKFSHFANNVDDTLLETIRGCASRKSDYYHKRYEHLSEVNNLDLVTGVIGFVIKTAREAAIETRSYEIEPLIFTTWPYAVFDYAVLWECTLSLPIGKDFVKSALNYIADTMNMHPEQKHETISDKFPQPKLSGNPNLYFAYGSNMNHDQMKMRCPSAQFMGLGELNNFKYYIDGRGVASIAPKNGASTWGVMWDIPDDGDWRTLDRYEGVSQSMYKRINTEVNMHPCEVYVSSTTKRGKPRPGYQENIVESVRFHSGLCDNIYGKKTSGQREDLGFDYKDTQYFFELWENEMSSWLEGRN